LQENCGGLASWPGKAGVCAAFGATVGPGPARRFPTFYEETPMDRREMLGALGAGAVGLVAMSAQAADKSEDSCCELDQVHADCLKACADCAKACDQTFHHCYTQLAEGKKEHAKALHLAGDCAGFCGLSACNIAKQSPLMMYSCEACAEACKVTAAEVGRFDAEMMKTTARKLRECEASCRAMVANMKSHGHSSLKAN